MGKSKEVEWVGHVYYPNGEVREVTVSAPSGNKFAAMGKVQKAVGISSPNDPSISGIKLQEEGKLKVYKSGRKLAEAEEQPLTLVREDDEKFKRYRIMMFPSPASGAYRVCTLSAANPYDAFTGAMARFSVKKPEQCGPYVVEEESRNGFEIKMAKNAGAFGANYGVQTRTPSGPVTVIRGPINQRNPPTVIPTKQAVHTSVAEAFRLEKKVTAPTYAVIKD